MTGNVSRIQSMFHRGSRETGEDQANCLATMTVSLNRSAARRFPKSDAGRKALQFKGPRRETLCVP